MFENLKLIIKNAYTPYSNYNVACILVMNNNQEFIGVNVENASYKNGLCAEQVAFASAIFATTLAGAAPDTFDFASTTPFAGIDGTSD